MGYYVPMAKSRTQAILRDGTLSCLLSAIDKVPDTNAKNPPIGEVCERTRKWDSNFPDRSDIAGGYSEEQHRRIYELTI